jgi:hypothetical protein
MRDFRDRREFHYRIPESAPLLIAPARVELSARPSGLEALRFAAG